ncbi:hypothetical protein IC582_012823 [Cucumis melo]
MFAFLSLHNRLISLLFHVEFPFPSLSRRTPEDTSAICCLPFVGCPVHFVAPLRPIQSTSCFLLFRGF